MRLFHFLFCFRFLFLLHKKVGSNSPLPVPLPPWCRRPCLVLYREVFFIYLTQIILTDSPSKFVTGGSIRQRSTWRSCPSLARKRQPKKKVFSCFNFSTTVWLSFSRSLVSNFTPIWPCIENNMKIMWKTALTLIWNDWQI